MMRLLVEILLNLAGIAFFALVTVIAIPILGFVSVYVAVRCARRLAPTHSRLPIVDPRGVQ